MYFVVVLDVQIETVWYIVLRIETELFLELCINLCRTAPRKTLSLMQFGLRVVVVVVMHFSALVCCPIHLAASAAAG
jgi:hypothetical protein